MQAAAAICGCYGAFPPHGPLRRREFVFGGVHVYDSLGAEMHVSDGGNTMRHLKPVTCAPAFIDRIGPSMMFPFVLILGMIVQILGLDRLKEDVR